MERQEWTILDENSLPVLEFTSFISMDGEVSSKITDYVSEKGSFSSYNKIPTPNELSVTLAIQGDNATLQNALSILDTLANEPLKVSIVCPYREFKWYSLENYNLNFNQNLL